MSNNSNSSPASGGFWFPGALTLVFIVLKLTGVITWSWWLVLSPLLIVAVIGGVLGAYIAWKSMR